MNAAGAATWRIRQTAPPEEPSVPASKVKNSKVIRYISGDYARNHIIDLCKCGL